MKIMLVNFLKVVNSAGGAERVFCNMANEFVKRNYDVYAICCDWEKGLPFYKLDNRVNFINIDGSGTQTEFAKYLKFAREVLRLFKKVSNDNPYDNEKNRYWSSSFCLCSSSVLFIHDPKTPETGAGIPAVYHCAAAGTDHALCCTDGHRSKEKRRGERNGRF